MDTDSSRRGLDVAVTHTVAGLGVTISNGVLAILMATVTSEPASYTAELWLGMSLHIFAIPLAFLTGLFSFPLWVWFVIALQWAGSTTLWLRILSAWGPDTDDETDELLSGS